MGRIVARHHSSVGELTNKDPYEESDKDEKTVGRLSTIHSRNNTKIGRLWHSRLVRFEIKKEERREFSIWIYFVRFLRLLLFFFVLCHLESYSLKDIRTDMTLTSIGMSKTRLPNSFFGQFFQDKTDDNFAVGGRTFVL